MNHFTSSILVAAIVLFSATASFANTAPIDTDNTTTTVIDHDVRVTYNLAVLAVHPDGNRAFTSGTHSSLSQALMAYQSFSANLPKGSTVIYANITDSDGNLIHSIDN